MDGLLGSEFKVLLRDSVHSTPRRRRFVPTSPTSPVSPVSPLPSELPREGNAPISVASLGLRLNLQPSETSAADSLLPTSPTSPLPSNLFDSLTLNSPLPTKKNTCDTPTTTVNVTPSLTPLSPTVPLPQQPVSLLSPALSSSSTSSSSSMLESLPTSPAGPPSFTQSLDVLAFVSAEQQTFSPTMSTAERSVIRRKKGKSTSQANISNAKTKGNKVTKQQQQQQQQAVVKAFKCALCPSTFSQQFNLNKHVRAVHERRRPFQCEVCHARFQQKSHRTMHFLAVHEKLRQFSCDRCPASFSWRGVLKKHRKSIHGIDD